MKLYLKSDPHNPVEVDTRQLYHSKYRTKDGRRVYDSEVLRIENDARKNAGICENCGALVEQGHEENHYKLSERTTCEGCPRNLSKSKIVSTETLKKEESTDDQGVLTTVETQRVTFKQWKECSRQTTLNGPRCYIKDCREAGIRWFTKENTFFLRFPEGPPKMLLKANLPALGFEISHWSGGYTFWKYRDKIATRVVCLVTERKATEETAEAYTAYRFIAENRNCSDSFTIINGEWIKLPNAWPSKKGIPEKAKQAIIKELAPVLAAMEVAK